MASTSPLRVDALCTLIVTHLRLDRGDYDCAHMDMPEWERAIAATARRLKPSFRNGCSSVEWAEAEGLAIGRQPSRHDLGA